MNNAVTIRLAEQKDIRIILEIFMQRKNDFFNHEVDRNKVGLTLHQSIKEGLLVMAYWGKHIPIGYCVGICSEDLWNFNKTVSLVSVYVFEDFRKQIEAKKMLLFWKRIAKKQGRIKWALKPS